MNIPLKRQIELHKRHELHVFLVPEIDIAALYEYFKQAFGGTDGTAMWPAVDFGEEHMWYVRPPIWRGEV
jgi:hypothetical protein